jgi:diguanylate cyclase (GGDEF)-like protein
MARTLASNLSVEDTVVILANRLSKLIPFTTCVVSLFDPSRSEYECVHAIGRHADSFFMRRRPAEAGITGWVITNQQAMYNTNPVLDLGFLGAEVAGEYKSVMVCPLVKNKEPLGAIALYSTEIEGYASEHINLMESICQPASDAVYNAITFEQAQRNALTDHVTGLANMRAMAIQFDRERARSQRLGTPMTLMLFTINNLGEVASRSQISSEQALASVGKLIKQQMRETDLLARFSDNALLALLPNSGRQEAIEVRSRLEEALLKSQAGSKAALGLGMATSPNDATGFEEMLQIAQLDSLTHTESIRDFALLGFMDDLPASSMSLK